MVLTSKKVIKDLFKRHQTRPLKRLGQNFLIDKRAIQKIIQAANLQDDDAVLEIGPGIGAITNELAKKVKKIIAVEKDPKMVAILAETLKGFNNVEVIQRDILKRDTRYKIQDTRYKIITNLPFYLTVPVIRKFLETRHPPKEMILVVQKEVAQRICASPPKMNLLAVSVQVYAESKIISYISKKSFWPQPKVDSAILKITTKKRIFGNQIVGSPTSDNASSDNNSTDLFFGIVKAGFAHPRKTILNNLKGACPELVEGLKLDKEQIKSWLVENNIRPNQRAETLSIQDWLNLTKTLKNPLR